MPSYSTPGVYIEEVSVFPPSIAPVATAVPAFIGTTQKAVGRNGEDLIRKATRITSLLEYEALFGVGPVPKVAVKVEEHYGREGNVTQVKIDWDKKPEIPDRFLYPSLRLYFANGGGPCYIYSIGDYAANSKAQDFVDAIADLEAQDEPTLLVFPDAVKLPDDYGTIADAALSSCNKMKDRFAILDVPDAVPNKTATGADVTTKFRAKISKGTVDFAKYGAAYFPYLQTNVPFILADADVTLKSYDTHKVQPDDTVKKEAVAGAAGKALDDGTLDMKGKHASVYSQVRSLVDAAKMTLPPSGAIAGLYAENDRTRGVWKAPANVGVSMAVAPAVPITNDLQDGLNIDPNTGRSVNVVRSFFGKGTMVWGARTLAGNDNEWRYVNVRRFANFVEESVQKAISAFVFEPNDANTWVKVRTMIENFLTNQWRDGALMGAKPEQAFKVAVGLGQTMSAQDVLDGYMIVDVHLAMVRPAEFIRLRFMQKMPEA
jgi:phage tail sheath protein FI